MPMTKYMAMRLATELGMNGGIMGGTNAKVGKPLAGVILVYHTFEDAVRESPDGTDIVPIIVTESPPAFNIVSDT